VDCQLAYLTNCFPGKIQDILNGLPESLDETYERTLREIQEPKWESAQRLLVCVTVAYRPLRVEELAEILAFDFKSGAILKFHKDWRLKNPVEAILSACSTLLSVVNVETSHETSRVVQFAHFTVKEFLTSRRFAEKHDNISRRYHISMSPAHTFATQACLGVLLHLEKNITNRSLTEFPLAEYAAKNWIEHAHFGGVSQDAVEGMRQLFDRTKPYLSIWLWIYDPTTPRQGERAEGPSPPRGTPLHYATFCGLHDIAKILAVEHPQDVNSRSFQGASTPLSLASEKGHVDLARMLIDLGADVSAQTDDGWTALHLASENGHVDLARMLIDLGADVSAQTKYGTTALHWASHNGHVDLARMLIDLGADLSAQTNDGWTALHWALENGQVDLARMLIDLGADVSARTNGGSTALHWASRDGHVDLARMLIDLGADVSAQTNAGSTALHWASENGHVDLARMLIDLGADVSAQTNDGSTALHWASRDGHVDLARMLIDLSADVSAQTNDGWTALHLASRNGHVDFARMLIDLGADMSAQTNDGWTALHWASRYGHVDLARMLIDFGADVSAQTEDGSTTLHLASHNGHVDFVKMLAERGTNMAP